MLDGVFSSWIGLFEGMTDEERVTVLLELLGRKVRVVHGPGIGRRRLVDLRCGIAGSTCGPG